MFRGRSGVFSLLFPYGSCILFRHGAMYGTFSSSDCHGQRRRRPCNRTPFPIMDEFVLKFWGHLDDNKVARCFWGDGPGHLPQLVVIYFRPLSAWSTSNRIASDLDKNPGCALRQRSIGAIKSSVAYNWRGRPFRPGGRPIFFAAFSLFMLTPCI